MKDMPLISVIVPVYKAEAYLDTCVKSLLAQSWENIEVILVNDGSPDNSGNLCDQWARKDQRIRVIHKENGGPSSARNRGLNMASGEYVLFVDSDDFVDPTMCQSLYTLLTEEDTDIAFCNVAHIFPGAADRFTHDNMISVINNEDAIVQLWYQRLFPSACGMLFKRSVFSEIRFTEGLYFEDIDILPTIFWHANRVAQTSSCLYGYVHHEGSITTRKFSVSDLDILTVTDGIQRFVQDKSEEIQKAAAAYIAAAALRVYLNAPVEEAFEEAIAKAQGLLSKYGKVVLKDPNIRRKNKCGLLLYFYCRPCMKLAYKMINRWR